VYIRLEQIVFAIFIKKLIYHNVPSTWYLHSPLKELGRFINDIRILNLISISEIVNIYVEIQNLFGHGYLEEKCINYHRVLRVCIINEIKVS